MSLKSSNKVDTNRWQLEVAVDAATFNGAVDNVYKKQKKNISLKGFRKGKAPRAFIEKVYGSDVFYPDAIEAVYPAALDSAIKEAKLDFVQDKIGFETVTANEKDGLVFKATITVKPEVEIDGYKGIKAEKKSDKVTDADISAELKKVQERNSRVVTVSDRAAANDDVVDIDFEGFMDGKPFDGGKAENYSLTLGAGQFIPGFEDQIVGKKTGDEFDVNVTFPEDYQAEDLKGKPAVFKVKLHEIKVKELPKLDDDFAKDVSDFDTIADYKADVQKHLEESKKDEVQDDIDNQLIDALVKNIKGEIPEAMYVNKANDDMRDFAYRLQSQGLDINTYMKYTGMDADKMRGQFLPQAERQVKIRLALEKIAGLEKLSASDKDIEDEYAKMAESYKIDVDKVKKAVEKDAVAKDISVEKAIEFVRDNAVITAASEKKPAAEKAETKKAAAKPAAKKTAAKKPAAKKTTAKKTTAKSSTKTSGKAKK